MKNNRRVNKRKLLNERQLELIELYGYCSLGMTPKQFYDKWALTHAQIAFICARAIPTVGSWFSKGRNYRRPTPNDLRHLAIMDFVLEHFDEIPTELRNLLCPRNREM